MIQQKFINRESELASLKNIYDKSKNGVIVIYGRRRVGKTVLTKEFWKNKPHLYLLCDEGGDESNIKNFKEEFAKFFNEDLLAKADIKDWQELFREVAKRISRKTTIIIDEFPYLIKGNHAIPSIFQKAWDLYLSKKEVFLVLNGSSISIMESHVLNYSAPLYGRRAGQLLVPKLKLNSVCKFFPKKSFEEIVKIYSVTDGIPLYLLQFNSGFEDDLLNKVLKKGAFLNEETKWLSCNLSLHNIKDKLAFEI